MAENKAFTLIEIIVVIIIIGILAAVALPRLTGSREGAVFAEAISAAQLLHASEARYSLEHNGAYSTDCTTLDVDVTPQNYTAPDCNTGSVAGNIGITRTGGAYTLYVSTAGAYTCPSCTASLKKLCPNTACP